MGYNLGRDALSVSASLFDGAGNAVPGAATDILDRVRGADGRDRLLLGWRSPVPAPGRYLLVAVVRDLETGREQHSITNVVIRSR